MRKFALVWWGMVGHAFVKRYYEDQITMTMLKMHDYLPIEVKRAIQDKDFRHLALFDQEEEGKTR